jgi:hypothetical protein
VWPKASLSFPQKRESIGLLLIEMLHGFVEFAGMTNSTDINTTISATIRTQLAPNQ